MNENEKSKKVLRALTVLAKTSSLSINELRVIVAIERLVARLEVSKALSDKLIFKGGFVLLKAFDSPRFTRDLDALAQNISKELLCDYVRKALVVDLHDGLYFGDVTIDELIDQGHYGGLRINVPFQIGHLPPNPQKMKKLSRLHLDIGFGDVYFGEAKRSKLRSMIEDAPPVSWRIYPAESIFAEKLETLVIRGSANSRSKDLYDLTSIFESLTEMPFLRSSIERTFTNRTTSIPLSFRKFFNALDLTILRNSWGSVQLQGGIMTFEECLGKLEVVLEEIDTLFGSAQSECS